MLRLFLGLLPVLALSAWNTAEAEDDSENADDDADADDNDDSVDIDGEVQKRLNSILGNERRKLRTSLRDEVRAELEAERERAQQEEAEEFKPLYEKEQLLREAAETEAQRVETEWRTRLVRSEIKAIAANERFIKPEVAEKLIDLDAVTFDDAGEPKNIETLVKHLAKDHPYLLEAETDARRKAVEHSRSNGNAQSRDEIKNRYLRQAGKAPAP